MKLTDLFCFHSLFPIFLEFFSMYLSVEAIVR